MGVVADHLDMELARRFLILEALQSEFSLELETVKEDGVFGG